MSTLLVADVGGTTVKIGFVVNGVPQAYVRLFPSANLRNPHPAVSLARMIVMAIDESKLQPEAIVATVPGFLNKTATNVLFAANIPELNGCPLVDELTRETGLLVILERDAVLHLMGEYTAGGCRGAESALGIFFGTGVGASYLENGRAFRGSCWALEIGHMPYHGARRWLGADRTECLETYVSGKALERIAQEQGVTISEVFTAAKRNPALAEHVADFVRNQANAVGTAIAILSPETILLGGGICDMLDFPREELVGAIERSFPFDRIGQSIVIRWATLGWQSVLYGAPLIHAERTRTVVKPEDSDSIPRKNFEGTGRKGP
jgi:predicted NBD/HSP70 family sugar kinase